MDECDTYRAFDYSLIHHIREWCDEVRGEDLRIEKHLGAQESLISHIASIRQSCRFL